MLKMERYDLVRQSMQVNIKPILFLFLTLIHVSSCMSSNPPYASGGDGEGPKLSFSKKNFRSQDLGLLLQGKRTAVQQLEFDQCTFEGDLMFGPLTEGYASFPATAIFRECSFEGSVSAKMMQMLGQLNFGKCRFKKAVNFQNATFLGPVGFRECIFDAEVMSQNALFMRECNFMSSNFYGVTMFQSTRFMEKAQFGNAVFHANADFTMCRFQEGASFDFARFEARLDLAESRNDGLMSFRKTELKQTQLTNVRSFGQIRFLESTFADSLDTRGLQMVLDKLVVKDPKGSVLPKEAK